jgi:hypothetical protein
MAETIECLTHRNNPFLFFSKDLVVAPDDI